MCLGAKINGRAFLNLNEERLGHMGVSYGFQITVTDIIEELVCAIHIHESGIRCLCIIFTETRPTDS